MNRNRILASLIALTALALPVMAAEGRAVRTRPKAPKPGERMPESLVPAERAQPATAGPRRKGGDAVLMEAGRAGRRMAEELARTGGWVEAYRVGWFRGMNRALNDPSLGDWDREQGFQAGLMDRGARQVGRDLGRERAEAMALAAATDQVASQFRDLEREPRFEPRPVIPRFRPEGTFASRPELDDLFLEMPVPAVALFAAGERRERFRRGFDGWELSPDRLRRIDRYEDFHDRAWADPARAFRRWKRSSGQAAFFHRLNESDRIRFRTRFEASFTAWLSREADRFQRPAFAAGFDDGWEYGAAVRFEFAFREGFAAGFDQAVGSAAQRSFSRNWGRAFQRSYAEAFDDWMTAVRPAIVDLRLEDGDRDGVFEPGEALDAFAAVANLGGGSGAVDLRLEGKLLAAPRRVQVVFRGRGLLESGEPLRVRIAGDVPVRTRGKVTLDLAGERMDVPLLVARPLQFEGGWRIDSRDALAGSAVVEVQVANRSRRPVAGFLSLDHGAGQERDLGRMASGESRTVRFGLDGLDPLDVLSGDLRIGVQAADHQVVHDRLEVRFPNLAVDLDNDDLLTLLLRFAGDRSVPERDVARARSLMVERMRADWRMAARGRRNPYKRDFRDRTDETALGELVLRAGEMRPAMSRPEVFADLGRDLRQLSGELPGAHPFLRKWFRRLASRI